MFSCPLFIGVFLFQFSTCKVFIGTVSVYDACHGLTVLLVCVSPTIIVSDVLYRLLLYAGTILSSIFDF